MAESTSSKPDPELLAKREQLAALREQVQQLEDELEADQPEADWQEEGFYSAYYATTGFLLGMVGALASLMFNIVGSLVWEQVSGHPQHPLRLIQVYLTFPLGDAALAIDSGMVLAAGCCLYLVTGMFYGMILQLVLARFTQEGSFKQRLLVATLFCLFLWLFNFYGILSWLQPWLIDGNWIIELVPWWVAMLTHLVFGWTMVLLYPWGVYVPYRPTAEQS